MAFTIKGGSFFIAQYLKVTDKGIIYQETAALGGKRKFSFGQIEYVLMSAKSVLSFQVGNEVFSIPVKQHKPKHQQTMAALIDGVRRYSAGFPVQPVQ